MAIYPADPISDEQFSKWRFDGTYQARQLAILDLIRIATQAFGSGGYDFDLLNQEATQELIRLLLVDLEAKDFSTEATQLLVKGVIDAIKTNTDKLDVNLSTRNAEATQLLIKGVLDNIKTDTNLLSKESTQLLIKAAIDTLNLKDFATQTTLATRLSESDFDTKTGSLTETAPATDTASSGLNGRLQRIAERISSLISALGSPFQAGGNIGNTDFGVNNSAGSSAVNIQDGGNSITVDGSVSVSNFPTSTEISNDFGNPIPVIGTVTANTGLSQPLTDTQLRAAAVAVSLTSTTVTNTVAVSAASLPLPTGSATEATLASILSKTDFEDRINTLGQKTMAQSTPVVLASDQSTLPISVVSLPLPNGAASSANLTTLGSQTTKINDGTNTATVKAASTSPIATDTALVVSISPNSSSIPVALPTGASTLTEQQTQTTQLTELVSLFSSKLRDAAGRIRTSQPTSLGDYKILNNTFDALALQQVGTGTFTQNQNSTTMAVTSGQFAIIQTKQYHPYLNQKSQDWTMTFTGMGAATNVEKSIGYISSNAVAPFNSTLDGMRIFKDVSNNYFLQIWRNGTKIIDIARASWTDKLDGTGASGMNINWANFNVLGADFLYLGGTAVAFKIMHGRMPVIFHIHAYSNTDSQPIFNSPNKPLRWEIRSTTGTGSMNMICGNVNTDGELKGLGNAITIAGTSAGFTSAATGTAYAIAGVRKKVAQRDVAAMIDVFEATASSNDYFEVLLILNPTIAGVVTWADVTNTPFQSFQGVLTNIVTGGTVIANTYASQNMNNARSVENVLARLNSTITDTMDTIILCIRPVLGSTNVLSTGSMQVRWIT